MSFGAVADEYERARPGYPPEAIAHIVRQLGLGQGVRVADVGAGTGKLTRLLVASGAEVIAVEPVAGMRDVLRSAVPDVEVRDGTAAAMPFADGELDGITAAQAVHWFGPDAPRELARTLRPGGAIALVYNLRDRSQAIHALVSRRRQEAARIGRPADRASASEPRGDGCGAQACEDAAAGVPSYATGEWRRWFEDCDSFEQVGEASFAWADDVPHATVLLQAQSLAPIARLDADALAGVLAEVSAALAGEPDPITLRYTTEVTTWRRR